MKQYRPLREPQRTTPLSSDLTLVVFGEVFAKGYVNGLVEAAERRGARVIHSTVGRRDEAGLLRPLNQEEAHAATRGGRGPLINIPLEAGMDLTPDERGVTPVDGMKALKISDWLTASLDESGWDQSAERAAKDFRERVRSFVLELEKHLPSRGDVVFAHTMAGGVPRAKVYMPAMNRVFKGRGERFIPSESFIGSGIGRFALRNFDMVTADTYEVLLEETADLRQRLSRQGRRVSYVAYGYHGTEIFWGDQYRWQTYTCYFQGWAKMRLEEVSRRAQQAGIASCVFNCPEILTNSSSVFQGVEVSLYPFVKALQTEAAGVPIVTSTLQDCRQRLQDGVSWTSLAQILERYLSAPLMQEYHQTEPWPRHNRADQMEWMLSHSDELQRLHKNEKELITLPLSDLIIRGCGELMLEETPQVREPVWWLGHQVIAQALCRLV